MLITGITHGSLGGSHAGAQDVFVAKYASTGTLAWIRQLGTPGYDAGYGVATDASGNLFVSGFTYGSLGGPNMGRADAFVAKYDSAGTLAWINQLGTSAADISHGVATDIMGNVFIGGSTEGALNGSNAGQTDIFLAKYDPSGTLVWTRQRGTERYDSIFGVATDDLGNVFVGGYTEGDLGGANAGEADAFVAKYGPSGTLAWMRQLGTPGYDQSSGIATDVAGNVYISGITQGVSGGPNDSDADAFVTKYTPEGTLEWSRQLGTASNDESLGVATDGWGNVFISGYSGGSLDGQNAGDYDVHVAKYDSTGELAWIRQLGTGDRDVSHRVATDAAGNVVIAGVTRGSLDGPNQGSADAFIVKLSAPVKPAGDANYDGTVNALDLSALAFHWDEIDNVWSEGDFSGDGRVNSVDLAILAANWLVSVSDDGLSSDGPATSLSLSSVPEPSSVAVMLVGCLLLVHRREAQTTIGT